MALDGVKNSNDMPNMNTLEWVTMAEKQEVTNFLAEEKRFLSGFKKQIAMALTVTTFAVTTPAFSQESKWTSAVDTTKKTEKSITTDKETDPQDPSYTEKVTMADGTAFMVSKDELVLLEKYKAKLAKWEFATEAEMLDRFKTITLKKRESAKLLAETKKIEENIAKKDWEIAQIDQNIAKKDWEIAQIDQNIAKKDWEIAKIKTEKEQIAKKLQEVNNDIAWLNMQFKEIFEKQLGKKLSDQEVQALIKEVQAWDKAIDADTKIVDQLVQTKQKYGNLTQEQKLQLVALEKKWAAYTISLPYAQSTTQSLIDTIRNTLGEPKTLVYNK